MLCTVFTHSLFSIRNLTRSLRSLVRFLIRHNLCVNTVRTHFPRSILYLLLCNIQSSRSSSSNAVPTLHAVGNYCKNQRTKFPPSRFECLTVCMPLRSAPLQMVISPTNFTLASNQCFSQMHIVNVQIQTICLQVILEQWKAITIWRGNECSDYRFIIVPGRVTIYSHYSCHLL